MPDDLRTCATMCCNFIGDESASREQYEKALGSGASGGVVEKKIPCRKALTPAQDAIETAAGFYLWIPSSRWQPTAGWRKPSGLREGHQ